MPLVSLLASVILGGTPQSDPYQKPSHHYSLHVLRATKRENEIRELERRLYSLLVGSFGIGHQPALSTPDYAYSGEKMTVDVSNVPADGTYYAVVVDAGAGVPADMPNHTYSLYIQGPASLPIVSSPSSVKFSIINGLGYEKTVDVLLVHKVGNGYVLSYRAGGTTLEPSTGLRASTRKAHSKP